MYWVINGLRQIGLGVWTVICSLATMIPLQNPSCAFAEGISGGFEAGHQFALRFNDGEMTRERPYIGGRGTYAFTPQGSGPSLMSLNGAIRGFLDNAKEGTVDLRALNVAYAGQDARLTFGFQEVAWGESFGFYIADLVDPRDLRDPLFTELSWIRRANFTINSEFFVDKLSIQLLVNPVPKHNLYPDRWGGMRVQQPAGTEFGNIGQDAEFGGRVGYQFESQLKANLFYLYHWNRNPVFEPILTTTGPAITPVHERTHSLGITLNRNFGSWILRNDTVLHVNEPYQLGPQDPSFHTSVLQSILGADLHLENDWEWGIQYQLEYWIRNQRHWVGTRVHKFILKNELESELFLFQGINNSDFWIQPKITWFFLPNWSASLRADFISRWNSLSPGYFSAVDGQTRVMTWVAYKL